MRVAVRKWMAVKGMKVMKIVIMMRITKMQTMHQATEMTQSASAGVLIPFPIFLCILYNTRAKNLYIYSYIITLGCIGINK